MRLESPHKIFLPKVSSTFIITADKEIYRPYNQTAQKNPPKRFWTNLSGDASLNDAIPAQLLLENFFEPVIGIASENVRHYHFQDFYETVHTITPFH